MSYERHNIKSVSKDFGTEEEATNMLERAVNLINYNKIYALNIFTERTGGFNFKDLYPFCADDSGILTGHPFIVGFDLLKFIWVMSYNKIRLSNL